MRLSAKARTSLVLSVAAVVTGVSAASAAPSNVIDGTAGDDVLTGTPEADSIDGFAGADVLRGLGSRDFLDGGTGDDELVGGAGRDIIWGAAGDDVQRGGAGPDHITDGESVATAGTDRLYGGYGPDFLGSSAGPDRLFGEGQNDKIFFESPGVVADGGFGDDWLRAFYDEESSATGSTLLGAGGADLLETWVNDTTLSGGSGNDTLHAFVTYDARLFGGAGDDQIESNYGLDNPLQVNHVACGPGNDTALVSVNDDVAADCEVVLTLPS